MKKVTLLSACICLALGLQLTSCDDTELENAPYSSPVAELTYSISGRNLTLSWSNPQNATGAAIFKDGIQIASLNNAETTYTIANADDNIEHYYTVKAIYGVDGRISEGTTITALVEAKIKVGYYLTTNNYTDLPDDDEVAAAQWFEQTYIANNIGTFVHSADLSTLNKDEVSALWIQIDRIGIGYGIDNLPFSQSNISALKQYLNDGGNILLTKHATQLVTALERIDSQYAPGIFGDGEGGVGTDVWCMNSVIGCKMDVSYDHRNHPIFVGMEAGDPNGYGFETYPMEGPGLREDHNCMWDLNAYSFSREPNVIVNWEDATNSSVLAVWGHVADFCVAGVVEFFPTDNCAGKIIACGLSAYEFKQNEPQDGTDNAYQSNIELFTKNCIDYLK
ncbi:MAG: DUF4960 domain-containing protein [Bacteroidales bacterium]|nr:DUF4960 domain-containing protein [Bacteroidales bacterium]